MHGRRHRSHLSQVGVLEVEGYPVALLDLVHQPGQLHGLDRLGHTVGTAVAELGQQGHDNGAVGCHWFGAWARAKRSATTVENSPMVMPASASSSSSSNLTPNRSSTRTTSSAMARDSR